MILWRTLLVGSIASLALPAAGQGVLLEIHGGTSDFFGVAVGGAGDIDGDGRPDVVVGASYADVGGIDNGRADVVSSATGLAIRVIAGFASGDQLGSSVAGIGDVDADGVPDLLIGAIHSNTVANDAGSAYVISGANGSVLASHHGALPTDWFGSSVAAAGDVDNDGIPDYAIGAANGVFNAVKSGYVRVLSGATGTLLFNAAGDSSSDRFGTGLAGAGDADGDGFDDVVIGAPHDDPNGAESGSVFVRRGPSGALYRHFAGTFDAAFGTSVAGVGDVDGDGLDDVCAGAIWEDGPGLAIDGGSARVLSPRTGGEIHALFASLANEAFGFSVAGVGDVTGDGTPDFAVGAWSDNGGGTQAGSARVMSGATGAIELVVDGFGPTDGLGYAMASAGDVNQDGVPDVFIGAVDHAFPDNGYAIVVSGSCGGTSIYGAGCPGTGGFAPAIVIAGCVAAGAGVTLGVEQGPGGGAAFLLAGPASAPIPLGGGCDLLVQPVAIVGPIPLSGAGPGTGAYMASLTVPLGVPAGAVSLQVLTFDGPGQNGLAASAGTTITLPY